MRFGLLGQSRTILLGYFKSIRMGENKITSGLNENILRFYRNMGGTFFKI